MAQVLKDEVKDAILSSAKEEFQEFGFDKTSMRSIAMKSRMTVGNLYRYFKSKEELSDTIVSPAYSAINKAVEKISHGKVAFGKDSRSLEASPEELKEMLSSLSDTLVDIHKKHPVELNILMMGSRLNKELTQWFAELIEGLIEQSFPIIEDNDKRVTLLSGCYSEAIFGGIRTILRNWKGSENDLRIMIKAYLNSYLSLLDQDISKLV